MHASPALEAALALSYGPLVALLVKRLAASRLREAIYPEQRDRGASPATAEAALPRRVAPVGLLRLAGARRGAGAQRADGRGHAGRRHLRGVGAHPVRHQRAVPPDQLAHRVRAALDAPAGPLGDLRADRRLLHAVRAAGGGRHPGRRDPRGRLDRRAGGDRAQAGVDRRAQVAGRADLRGARLGVGGHDARHELRAGPDRHGAGGPRRACSTPSGRWSTRCAAPTPHPPSSATTRSSTCW